MSMAWSVFEGLVLAPALMMAALHVLDRQVAPDAGKWLTARSQYFVYLVVGLLVNASGPLGVAVLSVLLLFHATNLLNFGFYRSSLQPELMTAIFHEREDIFLTLAGNRLRNAMLCAGAAAVLALGLWLQHRNGAGGPWPAIVLVALFVAQGLGAKGLHKFKPRQDLSILENTFRAYQGFLFFAVPAYVTGANVRYVDVVETLEPKPAPDRDLVVLVIGESVAAQRMSLFGYAQDTTPCMRRMRDEGRALFLDGYSSSTSTVPATIALLLGLNDPRDVQGLRAQNANLFRLARASGFRTVYLSAQRANVVDRVDLSDVDAVHTVDNDPDVAVRGELALLERLAALPAGRKHFVVVQMRLGHSPYDAYTRVVPDIPACGGDPNSLENYESSLRAIDRVLESFTAVAAARSKAWDLFFTSDHGELFGEGGLFGHAMLSFDVARVPVAVISSDLASVDVTALRRAEPVNHYDLSCTVASALGWRLQRSGDETGYINGIGYAGASGMLTYPRQPAR